MVNWHCHTVLHSPFCNPCLLLGSEAFICSTVGCWCPGVFPSGLSVDSYDTQEGQEKTVWRGPSGFNRDEFESTWARTDQLKERQHLEYACAKIFWLCVACHTPSMCVTPPKIHGENFHSTAQICEICENFLPHKFPTMRYFGLYWRSDHYAWFSCGGSSSYCRSPFAIQWQIQGWCLGCLGTTLGSKNDHRFP